MEEWVDIAGFEGRYAVSKDGRVWSHISGKTMSPGDNGGGYRQVNLWAENGKSYQRTIHRLVLMAFAPVPNADALEVNHKDGNKDNNALDNLEWVTASENSKHRVSVLKKTTAVGTENKNAVTYRITEPDGSVVVVTGLNQYCREHGLDSPTMIAVAKGRHAQHKKYKCERLSPERDWTTGKTPRAA